MKKLVVNKDQCISCGACVALDPEHFEFDDFGLCEIINQDNLESEELTNAIEACPIAIIYTEISDKDNETNKHNEETINQECSETQCDGCSCSHECN